MSSAGDYSEHVSTTSTERVLPGPRPPRTGLGYGLAALVLVALVGLTWVLGGFAKRTDLLRTSPPGTVVATGPYELQFSEATAQPQERYDGQAIWEITMIGSGRTTGEVSIAPQVSGNGMFVSKDDTSGQIVEPDRLELGPADLDSGRSDFAPGLPLTPVRVVFEYDSSYRPGDTIRLAVSDLVYDNRYLVGGVDEWHNGTWSHQYYLPVRELPPAES